MKVIKFYLFFNLDETVTELFLIVSFYLFYLLEWDTSFLSIFNVE